MATGFLSGLAALATVLAAAVGILSQLGFIGSHDAPKQIIVTMTPAPPATPPTQVVALPSAAPSAKPSTEEVSQVPQPHRQRRLRKPHSEDTAALASSEQTPAAGEAVAATTAVAPAIPIAAPSVATTAAAATLAMIPPPGPFTISGAWRDMGIGACHLISQTGTRFDITNYDPSTGEIISQGQGTIAGNHVQIDLSTRRPVSMDLHIAPDGQTMYGKIFRVDGPHRTMWNYIGPACAKPG